MNSLRVTLLTTTAAVALSGTAYAADMAVKAPIAPPIPYLAFQGWYIGGNIGVARLDAQATQVWNSEGEGYGNCTVYDTAQSQGACVGGASGLTAGVQGGYDWQNRSFVYGVAADWSWSGLNHTTQNYAQSSLPFFRAKVDWLATFRTRMGLAVEDTLVYVTGGLALADIKSGAGEALDCPSYCYNNSPNKVRAGWVAGFGAEHKFNQNLSFFTEFRYYDFGHVNATSSTPDGTNTYTTEFFHQIFEARTGVNWRF
jgi:outer membrane immunogenic protein